MILIRLELMKIKHAINNLNNKQQRTKQCKRPWKHWSTGKTIWMGDTGNRREHITSTYSAKSPQEGVCVRGGGGGWVGGHSSPAASVLGVKVEVVASSVAKVIVRRLVGAAALQQTRREVVGCEL